MSIMLNDGVRESTLPTTATSLKKLLQSPDRVSPLVRAAILHVVTGIETALGPGGWNLELIDEWCFDFWEQKPRGQQAATRRLAVAFAPGFSDSNTRGRWSLPRSVDRLLMEFGSTQSAVFLFYGDQSIWGVEPGKPRRRRDGTLRAYDPALYRRWARYADLRPMGIHISTVQFAEITNPDDPGGVTPNTHHHLLREASALQAFLRGKL